METPTRWTRLPTHVSDSVPKLAKATYHWSATGPRNQHTTFRPKKAVEHQTSSLQSNTGQTSPCWWELATSTKWLHTGQAGVTHRSNRSKHESPQITKQAYRPPNWPKLETDATQDKSEHTQTFTRAKTHRGLHRSNRSRAPVRPV
jgi:hypothetical protein